MDIIMKLFKITAYCIRLHGYRRMEGSAVHVLQQAVAQLLCLWPIVEVGQNINTGKYKTALTHFYLEQVGEILIAHKVIDHPYNDRLIRQSIGY